MATTSRIAVTTQSQPPMLTAKIALIMLWQGIIGLACLYAATQILQMDEIFNLGSVVMVFLAGFVGVVGITALVAIPLIYRLNHNGRFIGMALNFLGMVLGLLYLGQVIGLYLGFDQLANGLTQNISWLYAIAGGYLAVWLGGRFDESSPLRPGLTRAGLGVMSVSLMILLLASGLLNSIGDLISGLLRGESLMILTIVFISATVAYLLLKMSTEFGETIGQRETWQGWLFLAPNFINFMLFFAAPLLLSFYLSFTDYDVVSRANFIGAQNYQDMLSLDFVTLAEPGAQPIFRVNHFEITRINLFGSTIAIGARDPLFWLSLGNTIRYCIMLLALSIFPALGLAMLLNSKIPGMKLYRAIFFIPSIAAVVGVALIWRWLYDPIIGYVNYGIAQLVMVANNLFGAQIADPKLNWLTDDNLLLISVVIMAAWQVVGFNTVIFLAGLQNVPKELMEAATVDGAGRWTRFRKITMPLIAPTTFFVTVTTLIAGLQVFSEVFVLVGASTSNAKLTTVFYLYQQGFQLFKMGYASATAWVLFIVIFAVTLIQFRLSSRSQAYSD